MSAAVEKTTPIALTQLFLAEKITQLELESTPSEGYSFAGGRNIKVTGNHTFAWGVMGLGPPLSTTQTEISSNDAFVILSNNVLINAGIIESPSGSGIYTLALPAPYASNNPRLYVNGNVRLDNSTLQIESMTPTTEIDIGLGYDNVTGDNRIVGRDIAETFETSEKVSSGDVLVLDLESSA